MTMTLYFRRILTAALAALCLISFSACQDSPLPSGSSADSSSRPAESSSEPPVSSEEPISSFMQDEACAEELKKRYPTLTDGDLKLDVGVSAAGIPVRCAVFQSEKFSDFDLLVISYSESAGFSEYHASGLGIDDFSDAKVILPDADAFDPTVAPLSVYLPGRRTLLLCDRTQHSVLPVEKIDPDRAFVGSRFVGASPKAVLSGFYRTKDDLTLYCDFNPTHAFAVWHADDKTVDFFPASDAQWSTLENGIIAMGNDEGYCLFDPKGKNPFEPIRTVKFSDLSSQLLWFVPNTESNLYDRMFRFYITVSDSKLHLFYLNSDGTPNTLPLGLPYNGNNSDRSLLALFDSGSELTFRYPTAFGEGYTALYKVPLNGKSEAKFLEYEFPYQPEKFTDRVSVSAALQEEILTMLGAHRLSDGTYQANDISLYTQPFTANSLTAEQAYRWRRGVYYPTEKNTEGKYRHPDQRDPRLFFDALATEQLLAQYFGEDPARSERMKKDLSLYDARWDGYCSDNLIADADRPHITVKQVRQYNPSSQFREVLLCFTLELDFSKAEDSDCLLIVQIKENEFHYISLLSENLYEK